MSDGVKKKSKLLTKKKISLYIKNMTTQSLSDKQLQSYLKRLLQARSRFSLSSAKADQAKNIKYLQLLKLKSKSSMASSSLPQQITTKNPTKLEILLEAYERLISRQPVTEQRLDFELTNLKINKKSTIDTLQKIINILQPMDDDTRENPIIEAKNIIEKASITIETTVPISDSSKWIDKIKNTLLRIIEDPDFCKLFEPYLDENYISSKLSSTGRQVIGPTAHKRKTGIPIKFKRTFEECRMNLEDLKKYNSSVCSNNVDLKYFSELCKIFSVEFDFGNKCRDIIMYCTKLAETIEKAHKNLDDDLIKFLKLYIPTRLKLKQNIQQILKSQVGSPLRPDSAYTSLEKSGSDRL